MPRNKTPLLFERPELLEQAKTRNYLNEILLPEKYIYALFAPVNVDILMVTDASGGFDGRAFGLAELLNVLAVAPGPWVRFTVTTAHRENDPSATLKNFRFDTEDLSEYDQIWLFGVDTLPSYLTDAELRKISEFMAGGGGVFATGDHEDLGGGLCARIPRVRNMRMWYWPNSGPNGEPVAPKINQADRHDTLTRRAGERIDFDHQSDDVPQEILPVLYSRPMGLLRNISYPHPVLCGPRGIIKRMPDHPHEGHCYKPGDLHRSFTFSGATFEEYPNAPDGSKPEPEVIAHSRHAARAPNDEKGNLNPKTFGSIAVYDGHKAKIGRVLVDATWHHFFNINLTGRANSPDPQSRQGFYGSAAGLDAYEDIKAFFRNIAVYLSRPTQIAKMRTRALWWVRFDDRIAMSLRLRHFRNLSAADRLHEYVRIGTVAQDVIGRLASRCQIVQWIFDTIELPRLVRQYIPPLDPIAEVKLDGPPPPPEFLEILEPALLGAAIYGAATAVPGFYDRASVERTGDDGLARIMSEAAFEAVGLTVESFARSPDAQNGFFEQFRRELRR